jgi:hypothetical protein
LFHPIRLALTGEQEGLELDLAVPAIDASPGLVMTNRERAAEFASKL